MSELDPKVVKLIREQMESEFRGKWEREAHKNEERIRREVDRRWQEHLKENRNRLILSHSICAFGGAIVGGFIWSSVRKFTGGKPQKND